MINLKVKTLIILPHLDDEFALAPLIKKMSNFSKDNLKFIYCSERIGCSKKKQEIRRNDNLKSLKILGINKSQVLYLNDYLKVEDNILYESSHLIFNFLKGIFDQNFYPQVFTLNFEGGHPDHDQIAILVNKLKNIYKFNAFYFPAYNSRNTLFIPYSVLRPLKSQENSFIFLKLNNFCWFRVLLIALVYSTERFAFMFLLPTLIYKSIFSKRLIYFQHINLLSVCWNNSLSYKRYKVKFSDLYV